MEDEVRRLAHHQSELQQLHGSQARLPPNGKRFSRLGIFGVHADEIIRVHNRVNKSIEQNGEVNIPVIHNIDIQPVKEEDGKMVVDVQERELTPFLSQNNEDGVPKIPNFGNVKEPEEIFERRIFYEEVIARNGGVSIAVGDESSLDGHIGAEENLRDVVDEFDGVWIHGG
mmetsp:Transcript_28246/g.59759  ORF Transcript_28246/g.59759 Transcript_28246/m.59759 type:complete len:171 (+) Transcript_28246:490-1002(+)